MFAYSTFNIVAGGLSVHSDPKNLLVLATGGITIIQVYKNIVTYLMKILFKSLLFFAGDAPIVVHNWRTKTSNSLDKSRNQEAWKTSCDVFATLQYHHVDCLHLWSSKSQRQPRSGRFRKCKQRYWQLLILARFYFQLKFFGFYAWSMIQRVCLPLCIFFRFHSSVILVEIWKNSYKTKLMDWTPKSRISICNKPIYPQAINVHFLKTNQTKYFIVIIVLYRTSLLFNFSHQNTKALRFFQRFFL